MKNSMWCSTSECIGTHIIPVIYINDIHHSSDILKFHLFADDTSTIYSYEDLKYIEKI